MMKYIAMGTAMIGTLGLGALFLLPGLSGLLNVLAAFLAPVGEALGRVLAWLLERLVDGMKNALDTITAIVFVAALVLGTWSYTEIFGSKRRAAENEVVLMKNQIKGHKKLIDDLRKKCGDRCRGK